MNIWAARKEKNMTKWNEKWIKFDMEFIDLKSLMKIYLFRIE